MIRLENPEKYARETIHNFIKNYSFDPFAALMQNETQEQKIYCACVNYLHELEEARENITETFYKRLNTAAGLTSNPAPAAGRGCSFSDLDILEGLCLGPSPD